MWILFALGSAFFAGITSILAKCGMKDINSNVATMLRTGVVLVFSWLMVFVTGAFSGIWEITIKSLLFLILSGIATGISWLCYFKALQMNDVNKVTVIDKCSTIFTMLLAVIFLGEKLSLFTVISMLLLGVGTVLMVCPMPSGKMEKKEQNIRDHDNMEENMLSENETSREQKTDNSMTWIFFALGSAIFAALNVILGKVGIENVDSNLGTAIRTIVVLLIAWQIVEFTGQTRQIKQLSRRNWLFLILSGCATGASWLCYYRALQEGPVSAVVPIDKLSILVTIVFSRLVFHEKLNKKSAIGLGMVVLGTLLILI